MSVGNTFMLATVVTRVGGTHIWTFGRHVIDRSRLFSLVIFHETQTTFAFFVSPSISATRSTLRSAVLVITSK